MKILQADVRQLHQIGSSGLSYLVVESQVYGQDNDLVFHLACPDESAEELKYKYFIREIADTGRTPGFFQNLGGTGIYRPSAIPPLYFRPNLFETLKRKPEGVMSFVGETWAEIVKSFPAKFHGLKANLGVFDEKAVTDGLSQLQSSVQIGHSII